ncbi:type VI secretion system contractile sheath small subunit [Metakosakonia massiliensis]|uniref:Type VI secretion system contractile sheath small subunit n=1 Tax=Phytobacter massiliensis TaxID=1485952 RepID=A0A6N3APP5_9ENTR|nr:type VI secretion system contractile sheath small subunit [Phytobacter massiliensis]
MSKSKSVSVAPKERINIKYVPATGDEVSEKELPLQLVIAGDLKGRTEATPVEERPLVSITKNNFDEVMRNAELQLALNVPNRLQKDSEEDLAVDIKLESIQDFSPDAIVQKVPELKKLVQLREALVALKGPMGNIKAFREQINQILKDPEMRQHILKELEMYKNA